MDKNVVNRFSIQNKHCRLLLPSRKHGNKVEKSNKSKKSNNNK